LKIPGQFKKWQQVNFRSQTLLPLRRSKTFTPNLQYRKARWVVKSSEQSKELTRKVKTSSLADFVERILRLEKSLTMKLNVTKNPEDFLHRSSPAQSERNPLTQKSLNGGMSRTSFKQLFEQLDS